MMSMFLVIACVHSLSAQRTFSSSGGIALNTDMEVSWTIGEPIQFYSETQTNIYTIGYQQPHPSVLKHVSSKDSEAWAVLFPNPVGNELIIRLSNKMIDEVVHIRLYGSNGNLLVNRKLLGTEQFVQYMSNFSSGNYILSLECKDFIYNYPVIKIKN